MQRKYACSRMMVETLWYGNKYLLKHQMSFQATSSMHYAMQISDSYLGNASISISQSSISIAFQISCRTYLTNWLGETSWIRSAHELDTRWLSWESVFCDSTCPKQLLVALDCDYEGNSDLIVLEYGVTVSHWNVFYLCVWLIRRIYSSGWCGENSFWTVYY